MLFSTYQSNIIFPSNKISLNNQVLTEETSVTLLGVQLNRTLTWDNQIDKICISLGFVISILFKLKMESIPSNVLLIIYKTLFFAVCKLGLFSLGYDHKGKLRSPSTVAKLCNSYHLWFSEKRPCYPIQEKIFIV